MKIAITASQPNMDAEVDQRFGRCSYFLVVDPETLEYETIENNSASSASGAGISTAQMVVNKDITTIITGNCGPNAYKVLADAGVKVITGVEGKIAKAIENYNSGNYLATEQPSVGEHFGKGS